MEPELELFSSGLSSGSSSGGVRNGAFAIARISGSATNFKKSRTHDVSRPCVSSDKCKRKSAALFFSRRIKFFEGPGLINEWLLNKVFWPAPRPSLFKKHPLIKIPNSTRSCQCKFPLWVMLNMQNYRSSQTSCFCLVSLFREAQNQSHKRGYHMRALNLMQKLYLRAAPK